MKIVKSSDERLVVRVPRNNSLANALRRSVDEVPVLAFDEVEFFKNDSALYDEVLAHRIGLIPLKTEKKMSGKTKLQMKLSKKGPCWVYSGDLKGSIKLVHENIPITLLEEGQELEFVADASLGIGLDHAKYSPGLFYYKNLVEVKSNKPDVEKIISNTKGEMKPEKSGSKWICDLTDAEVDEIKSIDKDAVSESEDMIFFLESWGQIPAKDILSGAVQALGKNLDEFEKALK